MQIFWIDTWIKTGFLKDIQSSDISAKIYIYYINMNIKDF